MPTGADAIMDQRSVASRMNSGKLYGGYITTSSRVVKQYVTDKLSTVIGESNLSKIMHVYDVDNSLAVVIQELWKYIVNYLEIIGGEQYPIYRDNTDVTIMISVLQEIIDREFYIVVPIDNQKSAKDIVLDLEKSIYRPIKKRLTYRLDGEEYTSDEPIAVETVYMLVLSKIADTWLASSTAKTNHFGVPISTSKHNKRRQPWSPNPVKTGETETRLYTAYAGREAMAELRDRSASIESHKHMYDNILKADVPTNIDKVINRDIQPYGNDKPVELFESILNVGGVETIFIDNEEK